MFKQLLVNIQFICKTFRKLQHKLTNFLKENNILDEFQSAFGTRHRNSSYQDSQ